VRKIIKVVTPYVFIAPHVILFIIFFIIPTAVGIIASFHRWNIFSPMEWVGLANYRLIFEPSESIVRGQFWNGLGNTFLFVIVTVPFQIALPLSIAVLLFLKPKGRTFFQAVFYVPTLLSVTSVTFVWLTIFNRSLGLFNNILGVNVNWFGEQPYAWMTIVITTLWWVIGGNMIIYIAALGGVDKEILEAGSVDGANGFKKFFLIILPAIRLPIVFTVVTSVISQFNIYGQPLMLTAGGPSESTFVLLMYIRNLAFGTGNPLAGPASAMATVLGLLIGVISVGQLIVVRKAGGDD